jgi:hypothetical protein
LSGPQNLILSDLVQQGFDPKSFDELLRRLDRRTWNYASGNDDMSSRCRTIIVEFTVSRACARDLVPFEGVPLCPYLIIRATAAAP